MDKKRLKIDFPVLESIDRTLKEECEKERITSDEVIFYKFKNKKLA